MAQSTFNNGDTYAVARATINGNATDAEARLGALEGGGSFNLIEVTPAQSPYTIASWDSIISVKNDTAPIDLILPAASNDDLGKEIEFWVEHNPVNFKVRMLAPSGSMEINNVGNDGSDWAKAEFNSDFPNYVRVKARCVGNNEVYINLVSSVYNALRYVANFSSTSDFSPYSYLKLDAVPTNFLTDNDSWWFAAKIEKPMVNDSDTQVLFGSNNFFVGYRGNGTYLTTSGTSGYLQSTNPTTIVEAGEWMVYNWDATANRYNAWINGTKVLDSSLSGATPPTTAPTDVWFGTEQVALGENTDITLSGMTDTFFNQTYTPIDIRGRWASFGADYNDPSGTEFMNYVYNNGVGGWYWLTNDQNTGAWTVVETDTDPATFTDGQAVTETSSEQIGNSSSVTGGVYFPSSSIFQVTYDIPTFPSGYGYPLQDCKISNISIGSGNLSDADAALFTSTQFECPTLSGGTLTNQWVPQTGNVVTSITGAIDVDLVGGDIGTEEI